MDTSRLVLTALLLVAAAGCSTGRLAKSATLESPALAAVASPDSILAIALETTPGGWGVRPAYLVELRRDGSAHYRGDRNVPILGSYESQVEPAAFDRLAHLFLRYGFFRMQREFTTAVTDQGYDHLRVTTSAGLAQVSSYGLAGPFEFHELFRAVDSVAARLTWRAVRSN